MAEEGGKTVESGEKSTSKSIVLVGHGGLDKLKIQEKERPIPGEKEVLLNVKTCGINFAEIMARQGMYDRAPKTPCVLGYEAAGVITQLGEGVSDLKVNLESIICEGNAKGAWSLC